MDRSLVREMAMKMLFAASLGGEETLEAALEQSSVSDSLSQRDKAFLEELVSGVKQREGELDEIIGRYARGWSLDRLGKVDLILLRMAVFEMNYMPDIPVGATINEAVELAKKYGEDKSSGFVNGILGSVARELTPQ